MNGVTDPYRVLQVTPEAEEEVIHAAFRALAGKYHPDRDPTTFASRRMSELNQAYAVLRDPQLRAAFDRSRRPSFAQVAAGATHPMSPPDSSGAGPRLSFGRYAGWRLADLARHDMDYLRWLARHSSGLRYRTEIYQILRRQGVSAA